MQLEKHRELTAIEQAEVARLDAELTLVVAEECRLEALYSKTRNRIERARVLLALFAEQDRATAIAGTIVQITNRVYDRAPVTQMEAA